MKIKILRATNASGKSLEAGKAYDVSDKDAKTLLAMGKAVIDTEEIKIEETKTKGKK